MNRENTKKGYDSLVAEYEYCAQREPDRAKGWKEKLDWALARADQYADYLGIDRDTVLAAWEERRDYWYVNYYQEANQPDLANRHVLTLAEWEDEGRRLYGNDKLDWKFRCPACGHIQTPREFKAAGHSPHAAYVDCASRFGIGGRSTCKWTIGGLLKVGGRYVIDDSYTPRLIFEFADRENI